MMHDTPQHNGVAEQLNHTLMERVHAVGHTSGLPKNLWGKALIHMVWVKNRTASRVLNGKTSYELLMGNKLNLHNIPEWGAHMWVHDPNGSKLDIRAQDGHWVGFDGNNGAHRIYCGSRITIECNMMFNRREVGLVDQSVSTIQCDDAHTSQHKVAPANDHVGVDKGPATMQIEGENKRNEPAKCDQYDNSEQEVEDLLDVPTKHSNPPTPDKRATSSLDRLDKLCKAFYKLEGPTVQCSTRQSTEMPYMCALREGLGMTNGRSNGSVLPRGMQPVEARGEGEAGSEAVAEVSTVAWDLDAKDVAYAMHAATHDSEALEPRTVIEADQQSDWPQWEEVINTELKSLADAHTWDVIPQPPKGTNVIDNKWVFKIKRTLRAKLTSTKLDSSHAVLLKYTVSITMIPMPPLLVSHPYVSSSP